MTTNTDLVNRKVVLARYPDGMPLDDDFRIEEEAVAEPGPGEVVVAVDVLSIDAFIRTILEPMSFHSPVPIGGTIHALGVGRVAVSNAEGFEPGDAVFGPLGVQTHLRVPAAALRKLDVRTVPATTYLGALGLTTGLTAYFGILEVAQVEAGETVVVSGAAGAVGMMAGQIAKIAGAGKVIGIAGGPAKAAFLVDELGYDAAIDYKGDDVAARLRDLAPEGIDVFFDNVGGEILDAALEQIHEGSRVVICGAISQYQHMATVHGPKNYLKLAERHARMEGYTVSHYAARFGEAETALAGWLAEGRLRCHEQHEKGLEGFGSTLRLLFTGGHKGKLLLDVD